MLSYNQALKDMQHYADKVREQQAEIERLQAALRELIEHTRDCEKRLDEFHGLGADAGAGCSIVIVRAEEALRVNEQNAVKERPDG